MNKIKNISEAIVAVEKFYSLVIFLEINQKIERNQDKQQVKSGKKIYSPLFAVSNNEHKKIF